MDIRVRRVLGTVVVATLAAVALLGGVTAARGAQAQDCDAVVLCLDAAGASEASAPSTPCLQAPACGGGAALTLGLLLAGVAAVAFALPPPRPLVLSAAPPPRSTPAGGSTRTLERPPR